MTLKIFRPSDGSCKKRNIYLVPTRSRAQMHATTKPSTQQLLLQDTHSRTEQRRTETRGRYMITGRNMNTPARPPWYRWDMVSTKTQFLQPNRFVSIQPKRSLKTALHVGPAPAKLSDPFGPRRRSHHHCNSFNLFSVHDSTVVVNS